MHTRNKEKLKINECLDRGCDYVVDNTNPTNQERLRYISEAKNNGYYVVRYYMQSQLQECVKRNNECTGKERIPAKAIAMTSNRLEIPSYDEVFDELFYVADDVKR